MKLYKESSKINPLLFFETFINNDSLREHEDQFYNYPINPSQENFRNLGYLQYTKDLYEENEKFKPVTVFYLDTLKSFLSVQVNQSLTFLNNRKDKFDYKGKDHTPFTSKSLDIVYKLKNAVPSDYNHKDEIMSFLVELENKIKLLLDSPKVPILEKRIIKTTQPYFEPIIKTGKLKKLYQIAIELYLINDEIVSEKDFLEVLMSNDPKMLENKIQFMADNQKVVYFITLIQKHFKELTFSRIVKSEAFLKQKTGIPFSQNDLDSTNSRIKKLIKRDDFKKIKNSLDSLE